MTFETNGGTLSPDKKFYTSKAAYGSLPTPTRTGYTFVRWATREGVTVTGASRVPQTDITLYAVWKPNTYTIVFLVNGGEGAEMERQSFECGVAKKLLGIGYTWPGHTFLGWSTHPDVAWIDQVAWTPRAPAELGPSIAGDTGATVTGDAETGFVVTPSKGRAEIEVTIPEEIDAAKVTVVLEADVMTVKPNGAKVMIMKGSDDIAPHLDIPVRGDGVLAVGEATVKGSVVKEVLDPAKGAEINFGSDSQGGVSPVLTTAPTKPGLVYTLHEGTTLNGMTDGDSTIGNGEKWTPEITVKGGKSGFYSIGVTK